MRLELLRLLICMASIDRLETSKKTKTIANEVHTNGTCTRQLNEATPSILMMMGGVWSEGVATRQEGHGADADRSCDG